MKLRMKLIMRERKKWGRDGRCWLNICTTVFVNVIEKHFWLKFTTNAAIV